MHALATSCRGRRRIRWASSTMRLLLFGGRIRIPAAMADGVGQRGSSTTLSTQQDAPNTCMWVILPCSLATVSTQLPRRITFATACCLPDIPIIVIRSRRPHGIAASDDPPYIETRSRAPDRPQAFRRVLDRALLSWCRRREDWLRARDAAEGPQIGSVRGSGVCSGGTCMALQRLGGGLCTAKPAATGQHRACAAARLAPGKQGSSCKRVYM